MDMATEQDITKIVHRGMAELMNSMMNKMRPQFEQMALDAGEHGAKIAMFGDDIEYLKNVITKKEEEIHQLQQAKNDLEHKLNNQGKNNAELQLLINQKQNDIVFAEHQLKNTSNRLAVKTKELKDEKSDNERKMQELQNEIKEWKTKADDSKTNLGRHRAAEHIAKKELPEARAKISELETQVQQLKDKLATYVK